MLLEVLVSDCNGVLDESIMFIQARRESYIIQSTRAPP
jgi:hypothetical protein